MAIRRPFILQLADVAKHQLAVDVRMAAYSTDGACLQGDDGVDLAVQPLPSPPLIGTLL
jgi:hypothetical protein